MHPESERLTGRYRTAARALHYLLAALSILCILLFFYAALKRLHYPFELERMESGQLTSAWRVANHHPLYEKPSFEWAAYLYAPLYFYVSAAMMKITGAGYVATRGVSILSVAGIFAAIYAFVFLENRRHLPALAAAGMYASLYSVLGAWYDLGRVDSFTTFLFLIAMLATRYLHPAVAAFFWLAVFQAKQGFLPLPVALYLFEWQRPKRMLSGMAVYVALAAGSIAYAQHATHGWYSFYVFGTTGQLGWVSRMAVLYLPNDLGLLMGIGLLMAAVAVCVALQDGVSLRSRTFLFYAWSTFMVVGLIGYVRAHAGSASNTLFPVYAWLSVVFGIALARLLRWSESLTDPRARNGVTALLLLAACGQLAIHLYNPGKWFPNADRRAERTAFLEQLRAVPGDVWVTTHSWDTVLAGKPLHPEMDAFDAVLVRPISDRTRDAVQAMQQAYEKTELAGVVIDSDASSYTPRTGFLSDTFHQHYGLRLRAAGSEFPFMLEQPRYIYVPCNADQLPGDPWQIKTSFVDRSGCP